MPKQTPKLKRIRLADPNSRPKVYNAVPDVTGGTFVKNLNSLEEAKAWSKDYANYANVNVDIYENRPIVDKFICTVKPDK